MGKLFLKETQSSGCNGLPRLDGIGGFGAEVRCGALILKLESARRE